MSTLPVHLYLPRDEAKELQDGKTLRLLYPVPETLMSGTYPFRVSSHTSAQFPVRRNVYHLAAPSPDQSWHSDEPDAHGWANVLNAGCLWNFVGDATHSTGLLRTPHGLAVGQEVTVENRYNVPPTPARVAHIELARVQGADQWLWVVELAPAG